MTSRRPYDEIGKGYTNRRRADPRLAARLHAALGSARSVLNVGAGAGAYEPTDRATVALEPSAVMLAQRPPGAAPAVQGHAEALPFATRSIDAVLAVLTVHHWTDPPSGLAECVRVARQRVVLFTWDPTSEGFWLVRDYLPALLAMDRARFLPIPALAAAFGPGVQLSVAPVPIPHDCADGFLGAYWRRPASYLDPEVRAGMSSFACVAAEVEMGLERLRADLGAGAWQARHAALRAREQLDIGYRLIVGEIVHAPAR